MRSWVHVRRRFVEATQVQAKGKRGRADQAIAFIGRLYGIEREVRDKSDAERFAARQTRSLPVLAQLRRWLEETLPLVPPKSVLGEALADLHGYWPQLIRYTERGDLPIDNNPAHADNGMKMVMPTPGLCRCNVACGRFFGRMPAPPHPNCRHNQRPSRKASKGSGGLYLVGTRPLSLACASARSFSRMSACK
jgi:hypothetical protein